MTSYEDLPTLTCLSGVGLKHLHLLEQKLERITFKLINFHIYNDCSRHRAMQARHGPNVY